MLNCRWARLAQTYVTNLNALVAADPALAGKSLVDLIRATGSGPVFNNAAQARIQRRRAARARSRAGDRASERARACMRARVRLRGPVRVCALTHARGWVSVRYIVGGTLAARGRTWTVPPACPPPSLPPSRLSGMIQSGKTARRPLRPPLPASRPAAGNPSTERGGDSLAAEV